MAKNYGGAKVGHRIGAIVSQYVVSSQTAMVHLKHKLAMAIFSSISDVISEEVHDTLGPMLRQMHDELDENSVSHGLVKFMATKHGQLQAGAGISAAAGSILGSLAQIVNNELAPSVRGILETNPHLLPDPQTLAVMAAGGIADTNDVVSNIAQQGINSGWANAMIEMNRQYPDSATMLDMMRRGLIGRDNFIEWSIKNRVPVNIAEQMANLIDVPLSPADAALALLRGNISQADAEKAAAAWGVTAANFDILVNNTGEPIALMQLLEAYRRGFINKERLDRGILQSRIRNEWIDVAEQLRFSPMSVSDAVNAVVQNHIDPATGATISEQNGLEPGSFGILVETAGEPLSRTEMESLYNRGLATKTQVIQALRESRLKDKYGELAFELHTRLISVRDLSDAVVYGAISLEAAIAKAMEEGYSHEDASILISAASNRKLETSRKAVVSAVETLYIDGAMSREEGIATAEHMGYSAIEAETLFDSAEYKRQARLRNAATNVVRNKFVTRKLEANAASGLLDALGVVSSERDQLISLWESEREANVRVLTEAQIIKALKHTAISQDEAFTRLKGIGYSDDDANLLIAIG